MMLSVTNILSGIWITFYNFLISKFTLGDNSSKISKWCLFFLFTFLHAINLQFFNVFNQVIIHILLIYCFTIFTYPFKNDLIIPTIIIIYFIRILFDGLLNIVLIFLKIPLPSIQVNIFMTSVLALIFTFTYQNKIIKLIKTKAISYKYSRFHSLFINLFIFFMLLVQFLIFHPEINYENIVSSLITFLIFNLGFILIDEKLKIQNYIEHYQKIVDYSTTTENLLTKYKSSLHENKNQLIIIQSLAHANKEIYDYVSFILEEKENSSYHWLNDVKNIPIAGVKGLINYKILKMQELNINFEIYTAENICKYASYPLSLQSKSDLYTILGVYLDNAIEASLESLEKMITIQVYEEENNIIFLIANTFKDVDILRINENGYSSKDKTRGVGLYLVNNIIKKSSIFVNQTNITDNFFVQKLYLKTK